jgi:hypothetical protein
VGVPAHRALESKFCFPMPTTCWVLNSLDGKGASRSPYIAKRWVRVDQSWDVLCFVQGKFKRSDYWECDGANEGEVWLPQSAIDDPYIQHKLLDSLHRRDDCPVQQGRVRAPLQPAGLSGSAGVWIGSTSPAASVQGTLHRPQVTCIRAARLLSLHETHYPLLCSVLSSTCSPCVLFLSRHTGH